MATEEFGINIVADATKAISDVKQVETGLQRAEKEANDLHAAVNRAFNRDAFGRFVAGANAAQTAVNRTFNRDAFGRFVAGAGSAQAAVRETAREIDRAKTSADQLSAFLRRALSTTAIIAGTRAVIGYADAYTGVQNRLRNVTDGQEGLARVTQQLLDVANRTRSSFESTAELYTRVALSARELGRNETELIQFTESLNKAILLSGASAVEAQAGLIQLSQGIASGALRGDELRSVLEQLPVVADVIARQLGVTRGELRRLGEQGAISAEVILDAFKTARVELDQNFGTSIPTVAQGFQTLKNETLAFIGATDQASGSTRALAESLDYVSRAVKEARDFYSGYADVLRETEADSRLSAVGSQIVAVTREIKNLESRSVISQAALDRIEQLRSRLAELQGQAAKVTKAAPVAEPGPSRSQVSRELREEQELLDKLFGPQKRLAEGQKVLQRALDGGRISAQQYAEALALLGNRANDAAAKMNPLRQTLLDLQAESKELELVTSGLFGDVEATAQRRIRDVDQQGGFAGLTPDQRKTGEDAIRNETARNELLRQQAGLYQDVVGPVREYEATLAAANAQAAKTPELVGALQRRVDEARVRMLEGSTAVGDGFERAFLKAKLAGEDFASAAEQAVGRFADIATDSINRFLETGEFSFRQFASSILTEIQRIIVRMLVLQALGAAFGGAGGVVTAAAGTQGFAEGGTTQPGRSYIVGERGPELFSPGRTGSVTPNASSAGGQAPQVNVQVVTVEDPQLVPSTIAGGAADEVIVQAIGRNRDRVRQVIG